MRAVGAAPRGEEPPVRRDDRHLGGVAGVVAADQPRRAGVLGGRGGDPHPGDRAARRRRGPHLLQRRRLPPRPHQRFAVGGARSAPLPPRTCPPSSGCRATSCANCATAQPPPKFSLRSGGTRRTGADGDGVPPPRRAAAAAVAARRHGRPARHRLPDRLPHRDEDVGAHLRPPRRRRRAARGRNLSGAGRPAPPPRPLRAPHTPTLRRPLPPQQFIANFFSSAKLLSVVVSIVQATRIKARIRVRNRQKAALRISRAARLYLGSKNLTSLRRKHAIAAGAKSVARQLRRRAGANAGNASFCRTAAVRAPSACAATPRHADPHLLDSPARGTPWKTGGGRHRRAGGVAAAARRRRRRRRSSRTS